ncbi:MAG TPA: cupin-like domain-containing protein [Asticcacaulis sp.]|nr:cupin-like domain-containing protein [Asticcacaulis sp.]
MNLIATFESLKTEDFAARVRGSGKPAILKGLIKDWPAVKTSAQSDEALVDYLKARDNGQVAGVYLGAPEIRGNFFYGADTRSENFRHGPTPIPMALDRLLQERDNKNPSSIYVQSAVIAKHMPGFAEENVLDLLPGIAPRIWIGNEAVTRAHYDLNHNIACVVAGRRRFHLFPPEQLINLYPGPFDRTIGGVPVSMVDAENPDLVRYPRFTEAQKVMQTVELDAGDALYIPYGWWHQVHSLSRLNVLVNYWWDEAPKSTASGYDALFHAILAIRDMPPDQQALWKTLFDYYVFTGGDDPLAHLKDGEKGSLGPLTPELTARIRAFLRKGLT